MSQSDKTEIGLETNILRCNTKPDYSEVELTAVSTAA